MGSVRGLIPVEFLLIMHALPPRLPSREKRERERQERLESVREAARVRKIEREKSASCRAGREERYKREQGRRQQEGLSERKTVYVTRLSSFSSSSSFAFPVRASPITTRRCSPTVGRFTYKFNKHISYLMHALSRECFDRPGPPFSSSTRSSARRSTPRAPPARKLFGSSLTSFYSALRFQSASCAGNTGG